VKRDSPFGGLGGEGSDAGEREKRKDADLHGLKTILERKRYCDGSIFTLDTAGGFKRKHTLFADGPSHHAEALCEGGVLLHGFALAEQSQLFAEVIRIAEISPFRQHELRLADFRMSIADYELRASWLDIGPQRLSICGDRSRDWEGLAGYA